LVRVRAARARKDADADARGRGFARRPPHRAHALLSPNHHKNENKQQVIVEKAEKSDIPDIDKKK
jgi:hypothetical protein